MIIGGATNSYFPNPLDIREIGDGRWQLLNDYIFLDPVHGAIIAPLGTITDFYSVPGALRSLVSAVQESNGPAVIHDWIYRTQMFKQRECDRILSRAMVHHWSPVPWWNRKKTRAGLTVGGWRAYGKHGRNLKELANKLGRKPSISEIVFESIEQHNQQLIAT